MNHIEFGDCRETMRRWASDGATAQVALQHGRQYLGCELDPEYRPLQEARIASAALAAGMTPVRMSDDGRGLLVAEQAEPWRPHTGIADAARLAARIRAASWHRRHYVRAQVRGHEMIYVEHDGSDAGRERAYCEAVTLCAAAIGRRMREDVKGAPGTAPDVPPRASPLSWGCRG